MHPAAASVSARQMTARSSRWFRPDFLDTHPEIRPELVTRPPAAVDLDDQRGRWQTGAHVDVTFHLHRLRRRGIEIEAGVGLERPVVAQQAERPGEPPRDDAAAFGKRVLDATEELRNRHRRLFMGDPRLRDELGETRVLVVPTARRVVMVGETIEEPARHGDLDPHRGVRAAAGHGFADRLDYDIGGNGRGCHVTSLPPHGQAPSTVSGAKRRGFARRRGGRGPARTGLGRTGHFW